MKNLHLRFSLERALDMDSFKIGAYMIKSALFTLMILFSAFSQAADLESLSKLFHDNFNTFYSPRLCGKNISLLLSEASKRNIDLSNSYVLKIEGSGFLETSGFYTRKTINEREMLGYFHYVLVADGFVFDFDLAESLVLKLDDYVRLQFTPAYMPYTVFGMVFDPLKELPYWTITSYDVKKYMASSRPEMSWSKKMDQFINLKNMMKKKRVR